MANSLEDLQNILDKITEVSEQFGLSINIAKTKMMIISRKEFHNINLIINGETIERVLKFKYLGATLNEKWDCA